MGFRDLNEINYLTVKTDFMIDVCDQGNNITDNLNLLKELGANYNEVFKMVLKIIEGLKGKLADGVIEKMIISMNEVYNVVDGNEKNYINLLNCYVYSDIDKYDLQNLYNEDLIMVAPVEFNMIFAPYYLNVLVERYGDIHEINRVNCIVKDVLAQFKEKYGRN